jgi:[acyl-carrier-protein] S-malonyltransferase
VKLALVFRGDTFVELGPGTVLGGLIEKTARGVRTLNVDDPASLERTLEALAVEDGVARS